MFHSLLLILVLVSHKKIERPIKKIYCKQSVFLQCLRTVALGVDKLHNYILTIKTFP